MAETMTRGQIQDLVGKFASENPKYPGGPPEQPEGHDREAAEHPAGRGDGQGRCRHGGHRSRGHPYAAAEGELSDSDLERVAGGKQDITANCLVLGGTAVSNTVMQLNL